MKTLFVAVLAVAGMGGDVGGVSYSDSYVWDLQLGEHTGTVGFALRWRDNGNAFLPSPPHPPYQVSSNIPLPPEIPSASKTGLRQAEIVGNEVRVESHDNFHVDAWLYMPLGCLPFEIATADDWIACVDAGRYEIFEPYRATGYPTDLQVTIDPKTGELTNDGTIDARDAALVFFAWGTGLYDFNRDGMTDAADAGIMFGNWTGDSAPPASVPEPSMVTMLLMAFFSLARKVGYWGV